MAQDLGKTQVDALLAHTRLAVAATDAAGRMTLFSPALQELLGLDFDAVGEEEMVSHFDLYALDGTTPLETDQIPLVRARHGEVVTDAVLCARRGGTTLYLRCNAAPLRSNGEIMGAIVLVQDVTAEHSAQVEQDGLRERLVVTINHELRTPLTKLLGHAELLQDHRDELPGGLRQSLDVVCRSAHDLRRLADVISGLADLESHARLTKSLGDLCALVGARADDFAGRAAARDVRVRRDLPERMSATVDQVEVARAVEALLDNAVHYAPDGSEVGVRVTGDAEWVRIEVWDQGSGISPAERARLLQPFERGEHDRQPVNSRGLGLSIAHTVAAAHGGDLLLEDHEPRGLLASLVLPRHGSTTRAAAARGGGPAA